jgi:hypothetical protein
MALSDHEEVEKEQQLLLDNKKENPSALGDAPVMMMPDGLTYFHVKRNGLILERRRRM